MFRLIILKAEEKAVLKSEIMENSRPLEICGKCWTNPTMYY
jgi:hypothetical protein